MNKKELFTEAIAAIDSFNAIPYEKMFTEEEANAEATMNNLIKRIETAGLWEEFKEFVEG